MDKDKIQLIVVLIFVGLFVLGCLATIWDGTTLLKVATPFFTMAFGWLFTQRVTGK